MMKNLFGLFVAMLFTNLLSAQDGAKKYLLIEHFTNSNCSTCASRNPAFFNLISLAQYADDVHHVAVHPMFPYPSCVFYQANTTENSAWTGLYPIQGTPTLVLNGATQSPSNPLLTEAKLQTFLNQTSPLSLQVTEAGPNNARTVNVKAKAFGDIPVGNYKIFVAVLEKTINQQTGNGETVHHNVFRKMLTAVAGDPFSAPAAGGTIEFNYNYSVAANWKADEVYVLAFVKEVDTKTVLNSGTRFDPVLSGTKDLVSNTIRITPNPVLDHASVDLAGDTALSVSVFNANGQRVSVSMDTNGSSLNIATSSLASGVYFVKIDGKQGTYVGKFVKS